jgi:hypothetical protein
MFQTQKLLKSIHLILVLSSLAACQLGEVSLRVEPDATAVSTSTPSPLPLPTSGSTQTSEPVPQLTATETINLTEVPTPTPLSENSRGCSNRAEFLEDLSVQDGEEFQPGEIFLKTWRFRNAGTCTWDQEYTYVHFGGDLLGAFESQPLPATVPPGELLDLTLAMTAPQMPGQYLSEWLFQDASGNTFGVGQDGTAPFWVRISVANTSASGKATPYADSPAAGICPEFEGDLITMTVNPDVPDPRCVIVQPDQRLRVVNNLETEITASLGSLSSVIAPDSEHVFEETFGELLLPGVHSLNVTPCCGGSIWLK